MSLNVNSVNCFYFLFKQNYYNFEKKFGGEFLRSNVVKRNGRLNKNANPYRNYNLELI